MKKITHQEIQIVKSELAEKRKEFEALGLTCLDKKLKWIQNFFNSYVPELEERYMPKGSFERWEFLPDELRIQFYLYFPEHGLNMANYSQDLAPKLAEFQRRSGRMIPNQMVSMSYYDAIISMRHRD